MDSLKSRVSMISMCLAFNDICPGHVQKLALARQLEAPMKSVWTAFQTGKPKDTRDTR